jgi:hypothetical protein
MSPQLRRFLPMILLVVLAFAVLPQILGGGKGTKTLSEQDRGTLTRDALRRIDKVQVQRLAQTGRFTESLADLVAADRVLAQQLTVPLRVDLDVTPGGKTYFVQVTSDVIAVTRLRTGDKVRAGVCRVVKSRSKAKCPEPPKKTTTTEG